MTVSQTHDDALNAIMPYLLECATNVVPVPAHMRHLRDYAFSPRECWDEVKARISSIQRLVVFCAESS